MRVTLLCKRLKGDEKKEFENKLSDKACRCKQEKKTADLSRARTCRT